MNSDDTLELDTEIEIEIDELTDCIYDRKTDERYDTEFFLVREPITKEQAIKLQKQGWAFDWSLPQKDGYDIYKLTIKNDDELQGLIAVKHFTQNCYTHISLVESSPLNRGQQGVYRGTGGNLFAIACKLSWDIGNEGFVQFTAKTDLIEHYKNTLNAIQMGEKSQRMYIDTKGASFLINTYLKESL